MTFQPLKKNPLGLADFRDLLRDDYAYADKTRFIEAIDKINFPFIVRPRRFGKSMFTTMLQAYYDKAATDEFDSNFAGTYIAQHKTASANQFYVLRLVFSGLGSADHLEEVFQQSLVSQLSDFFETYPHPRQAEILYGQFASPAVLIERFFAVLGTAYRKKIYLIIDEYDQFANVVLSQNVEQFRRMTSAKGFLKDFYAKIKEATSGPVARIFITGVTSISLDSMTSGFSIVKNVTTRSGFASLFGFTEAELRDLIPQLIDLKRYGHPLEEVFARMKEWYNGYRFSRESLETVFNASMCLYYLDYIGDENREPAEMLDPAFSQDLTKITGILSLGDGALVRRIVEKALKREPIVFGNGTLKLLNLNDHAEFSEEELLSAMFYLGYLTYADTQEPALIVPNRAVSIQFFEYYLKSVLKADRYNFDAARFGEAFSALALGDPRPFFEVVCHRFSEESGLHTHLHLSESDFQTLVQAAFLFTSRYRVQREVEVAGSHPGYIDLLVTPTDTCSRDAAYLIELKFLRKKDASDARIEETLRKARTQAARYAESAAVSDIANLKRVSVVFVGTRLQALSVDD